MPPAAHTTGYIGALGQSASAYRQLQLNPPSDSRANCRTTHPPTRKIANTAGMRQRVTEECYLKPWGHNHSSRPTTTAAAPCFSVPTLARPQAGALCRKQHTDRCKSRGAKVGQDSRDLQAAAATHATTLAAGLSPS